MCFLSASHFVKKTCTPGSKFNKLHNFYCFIRTVMDLVMFCYQQVHSHSEHEHCLDSRQGARSSTHQSFGAIHADGPHSKEGKSCVSFTQIVLISWDPSKGLGDPWEGADHRRRTTAAEDSTRINPPSNLFNACAFVGFT